MLIKFIKVDNSPFYQIIIDNINNFEAALTFTYFLNDISLVRITNI